MPDPTKDFLGAGWKFPPRLDARGQIELVHQEQDIEEALRIILMTNKGERPMRPEFGSELYRLQFQPNDSGTAGLASRYVREALARWEPRIEVLSVSAGPADTAGRRAGAGADGSNLSHLLIEIGYRIRATNSDRNLVFPFYLIPGED